MLLRNRLKMLFSTFTPPLEEKRRKMERLIITLTFKKEKFIINLKTIINAKQNGTKIALTPIGAIFNFII